MGSLGGTNKVRTADEIAQDAFGKNWDELSNQERLEATRPLVEQATAKGSMTQQHLQEILILGPTFTSRDVDRVEKELDSSVGKGVLFLQQNLEDPHQSHKDLQKEGIPGIMKELMIDPVNFMKIGQFLQCSWHLDY